LTSEAAVIVVDDLDLDGRNGSGPRIKDAPATAYLQYTSGSTRVPAGVMISERNLAANFEQLMTDYFPSLGGVAPPDTTIVAWLPFYLLDPRSTAATSYRIRNVATSSLRILGVHTGWTPSWDRPVQITLGAALALLVVRRKRWPAVILIAVCARLLLDPSTKSYYDAGLLVGSMLCDLLLVAGPVPLFSLSALLLFSAPRAVLGEEPHFYGQLRTAYLLAVIGVLLIPRRWSQVAGAQGPTPEIRSTA